MEKDEAVEAELARSLKIFFCYSRKDKVLRDELEKHLEPLRRSGQITTWYDREILPGTEWKLEIDKHLNTSDIVLLLVSPNFIRSDYCYGVEMQRALERHKAGEARVIPIILRAVDWESTPIYMLQALPTDGKPILTWRRRDEAFKDVVTGLKKVVRTLPLREIKKDGDEILQFKQLYEDHLLRVKELEQLQDQFMVTASHELRTPLTAVQGYIELMAEYDEELPPEQRHEFLQKARRGCDELVVLLGNVMDASRLEGEMSIKPALLRRVSVEEMIDNVIILIEPHLTNEHRTLHKHIPPHLFVQADPMRLRQVLMNVSTNALKYSPPGTPIGFSARTAGPCVIISVFDKGKGVKPEHQAHIFQRFYRLESDVNSPVRGSGLGLYIAHRLIAAMGGKIWIESQGVPGEGSTFHVQLPTI